jgi:acyl dehydratase
MTPTDALTFDRLEVGREWVSAPRAIGAADIGAYSRLTGDDDPAHEDAEGTAADEGCARGLFGPAVATGLARDAPPVRTIAFLGIRRWEFLGPISAGDAVRIRNRVDAVTPRGVGRRAEVIWRVQVVNQHDDIVQAGCIITLVEGPSISRRPAGSPAG